MNLNLMKFDNPFNIEDDPFIIDKTLNKLQAEGEPIYKPFLPDTTAVIIIDRNIDDDSLREIEFEISEKQNIIAAMFPKEADDMICYIIERRYIKTRNLLYKFLDSKTELSDEEQDKVQETIPALIDTYKAESFERALESGRNLNQEHFDAIEKKMLIKLKSQGYRIPNLYKGVIENGPAKRPRLGQRFFVCSTQLPRAGFERNNLA